MAYKEKTCLEQECQEPWEGLRQLGLDKFANFNYCPFCSNQLMVRCSGCNEYVSDTVFNYCPWCGEHFEREPGENS